MSLDLCSPLLIHRILRVARIEPLDLRHLLLIQRRLIDLGSLLLIQRRLIDRLLRQALNTFFLLLVQRRLIDKLMRPALNTVLIRLCSASVTLDNSREEFAG